MTFVEDLREHIFHFSLRTKITLCIFLVILVPVLVLSFAFSKPLYNMFTADTIREEQNASSQIVPLIDEKVDEIIDYTNAITSQPYFTKWFYSSGVDSPMALVTSKEAEKFKAYINAIEEQTPIKCVKIYTAIPGYYAFYDAQSAEDLFLPESEITSTYWHGIFAGTSCATLFCPKSYLCNKEIQNFGDCAYIKRVTFNYEGKAYSGYLAVYYDSEIYRDILENEFLTDGSVSYIINDREETIVTTDSALSGIYRMRYSQVLDSLMSSNSFVEREIAGNTVYTGFYSIEKTGWFLVNVIPKVSLTRMANRVMTRIFFFCAICVLASLLLSLYIAKSITGRISGLSSQMSRIYDGPPVPVKPSPVKDEVGELIDSYNYMAKQINDLMEEREETAKELRYAEFNALQAQINPHFLYNTMDMINWMALQGRNREVSEVVQALSKFYKLTLSRRKDYSTIADELEHARVYVELQNRRFENAIDFVIDVPDELNQCRLPKLTLQPILENAILHGILEKENKEGTIVLTAWSEENDLAILISDDGVGMTRDVMDNILTDGKIKPTGSRGSRVAVVNIHRRLQLLYGERYGLSYSSIPGQGCEVTIRVPKHIGDAEYVKDN